MEDDRAAILRWTGRGGADDLESSVRFVLKSEGVRARVRTSGGSVVVEGTDPVRVVSLFENFPGVSWIAAGYSGRTLRELAAGAATVSSRYLRRGGGFRVDAEATGGRYQSDLAGALTSAILERVKGARVAEAGAKVRIRASLDSGGGAVGVELRRGPGGAPTGRAGATCLVSGGTHSSVVAWMSVLTGHRVTMVHAKEGEPGLRAAAKLYAELSHRSDPRWLRLVVLEGGSVPSMLFAYVSDAKGEVFGGFTSSGGAPPPGFGGRVLAPLAFAPEEFFLAEYAGLGIGGDPAKTKWERGGGGKAASREFGGRRADVSDVIDGLAQRPTP